MRKKETKECVAGVGTLTQAMQAQSVLASAAVRVEVVKADSRRHGCAYAIQYPCEQEGNVRAILRNANIRLR